MVTFRLTNDTHSLLNVIFFFVLILFMLLPSSHTLPLSPPFFLAAVNSDVYTGSSALAPAHRVPGVLSAVTDVQQQTGMA